MVAKSSTFRLPSRAMRRSLRISCISSNPSACNIGQSGLLISIDRIELCKLDISNDCSRQLHAAFFLADLLTKGPLHAGPAGQGWTLLVVTESARLCVKDAKVHDLLLH